MAGTLDVVLRGRVVHEAALVRADRRERDEAIGCRPDHEQLLAFEVDHARAFDGTQRDVRRIRERHAQLRSTSRKSRSGLRAATAAASTSTSTAASRAAAA